MHKSRYGASARGRRDLTWGSFGGHRTTCRGGSRELDDDGCPADARPRSADRAERWMGEVEIVSRKPDKSLSRTTYAQVIGRARKLARGLVGAGIKRGDRVATLMWNHAEHLEAYFGIPLAGAVRSHAEPPAPSRRDRVHRERRERSVPDRRRRAAAAVREDRRSAVRKFERVIVVGDAGAHDQLRGVPRRGARDGALPALAETDALGDLLHERHDRQAEGRRLLASLDACLHTLVAAMPDSLALSRSRHAVARRADVPRQRVGPAVHRRDGRREARVSRPAPRSAEPARADGERARDDRRRRADDLDRHPRAARRASPASTSCCRASA